MAGLVLLHSDFPDAMQGSAASKVPCGGEQQETFPRAGLSQHFVPGPCGERGSEPASSLIPVSIHFMSSCGSGLSCTSTQIDPFQRQALDFLLSLSLATVTC